MEVIQTLTVHSVTPGKDILEGERPWKICLQVIWVERSEERREGKSVDLGGRRIIKKKKNNKKNKKIKKKNKQTQKKRIKNDSMSHHLL